MLNIYKKLIKTMPPQTVSSALFFASEAIKLKDELMTLPASDYAKAEKLMLEVVTMAKFIKDIHPISSALYDSKKWAIDYDEIRSILALYHSVFGYMCWRTKIEEIEGDILRWGRQLPGLPVLKYVDFTIAKFQDKPNLVNKYTKFRENVVLIIQKDIDNKTTLQTRKNLRRKDEPVIIERPVVEGYIQHPPVKETIQSYEGTITTAYPIKELISCKQQYVDDGNLFDLPEKKIKAVRGRHIFMKPITKDIYYDRLIQVEYVPDVLIFDTECLTVKKQ